jgi:hypothetical protein
VDQELLDRLKTSLSGRQTIDLGQFQWVNLDMVRREAGDDWDKLRHEIFKASSAFIERRISSDDVLMRFEGGFMLVFSDLDGDAADEKIDEISLALNTFFIGDRALRSLQIAAEARQVSKDEFLAIVASGEATSLNTSADDIKSDTDCVDSKEVLSVLRGRGTSTGKLRQVEKQLPDSDVVALMSDEALESEAKSGSSNETGQVQLDQAQRVWDSVRDKPKLDKTPMWRPANESDGVNSTALWDEIVFIPVWDSKLEIISAQIAMARRVRNGKTERGRHILPVNSSADDFHFLDQATAITAQRGFQRVFAQKKHVQIGITINFETIARVADRVAYFSILQLIPQRMRRFFIIRVDGTPEGVPSVQLQEIFRSIRSFGFSLVVHLEEALSDLHPFEGCGIEYFSHQLASEFAARPSLDDDISALMNFTRATKRIGAEAYLTGIDGFDELSLAISVGARFVAGKAISEDLPQAEPTRQARAIDFSPSNISKTVELAKKVASHGC